MKKVLLIFVCFLFQVGLKAQTTYVWNGATTDWGTNTNWLPNGVPGTVVTDIAVISSTGITPLLDVSRLIGGLTINSGKVLNLGGLTLTVNGSTSLSSAEILNGTFIVTAGNLSISNAILCSDIFLNTTGLFGMVNTSTTGITDFTCGGFGGNNFDNNTISGSYLILKKTLSGNTGYPGGGNIINCVTTITATDCDFNWRAGGEFIDIFNNDLTIVVQGNDPKMTFATTGGDQIVVNGNLNLKNLGAYSAGYTSGTQALRYGRFGSHTISGNVFFSNKVVSAQPFMDCLYFGGDGFSMPDIKVGGGLKIGTEGSYTTCTGVNGNSSNNLVSIRAMYLTQVSSIASSILTTSGIGTEKQGMIVLSNCTFAGSLYINTPRIGGLSGSVFNNTFELVKTGIYDDGLGGSPTYYYGTSTFRNLVNSTVSSYIDLGEYTGAGDHFYGDAYFYTDPGPITPDSRASSVFHADTYFGCTTPGCLINYALSTANFTLTVLGKLKSAPTGFLYGSLLLDNMYQTGASLIELTVGSSATISLGRFYDAGSYNTWNSPVSFTGGGMELSGNTFTGTAYFEKTGNTGFLWQGSGHNYYMQSTTLVNNSFGGEFRVGGCGFCGSAGGEYFYGPLTLINKGNSSGLYLYTTAAKPIVFNSTVTARNLANGASPGLMGLNAYNSGANSAGIMTFNDDVFITNTRVTTGSYIYLGSTDATSQVNLSSGKNLNIVSITGGSLQMSRLYQAGLVMTTNINFNNMMAALSYVNILNTTFDGALMLKHNTASNDFASISIANSLFKNQVTIAGIAGLAVSGSIFNNNALVSLSGINGFSINNSRFDALTDFSSNQSGSNSSNLQLTNSIMTGSSNIFSNGTINPMTSLTGNLFSSTTTVIGASAGPLNGNTFTGSTLITNSLGNATVSNNGNIFNNDLIVTQNASSNNFIFGSAIGTNSQPNIFQSITVNGIGSVDPRMADATFDVFQGNLVLLRNVNWATGSATNGIASFTGSSVQSITGTIVPTIKNVTVDKAGGSLVLTSNVSVSGALALNRGFIYLNSKTLTMTSNTPTNMSRTSGYIYAETIDWSSKLLWKIGAGTGSFLYPFGNQNGNYVPVTLNITGATAGDVWVSTYRPTGAGVTPYPVPATHLNRLSVDNSINVAKRFWHVSATGTNFTSGVSFGIDLVNEQAASTPAAYIAQRWNIALPLADWDTPPASQTYSAGIVTVPIVPGFSSWAVVGSVTPLPIEFISFNVELDGIKALLDWKVNSENETGRFEIEKSNDAKSFISIGKLEQGNSSSYKYIDKSVWNGISYYRIKKLTKSGETIYSEVKSVTYHGIEAIMSIDLYPNPLKSGSMISMVIHGMQGNDFNIILTDPIGNIVFQTTEASNGGVIQIAPSVREGVYFLKVTGGSQSLVKKVVID